MNVSEEMKKNLTKTIDCLLRLDEDSQSALACIAQGMAIQTELDKEKKEDNKSEPVKL